MTAKVAYPRWAEHQAPLGNPLSASAAELLGWSLRAVGKHSSGNFDAHSGLGACFQGSELDLAEQTRKELINQALLALGREQMEPFNMRAPWYKLSTCCPRVV